MNGGGLIDHAVQADGHLIYDLLSDGLLQHHHDLLAAANGEGGDDDLASPGDGILDHLGQMHFSLLPGRLGAVRSAVGGLCD